MYIDLDNMLKMNEIDYTSSDYTQSQLGNLTEFSNIINSINLSFYAKKQMVKDITSVLVENISKLEDRCRVLTEQSLKLIRQNGLILSDTDNITEDLQILIQYLTTKDYTKFDRYNNVKLDTLDDLFDVCSMLITDFEITYDKELNTYDDIFNCIEKICEKENIKINN